MLPTDAAPLCQLSQGLSKSSNTVGLPFQSYLRTSRAFLWLCFCDIPRENRPFHISLPHATSLIPSTCLLQTLAPSVLFTCLLPHPHISLQCLLAIHNLGTSSEEVGLGALWLSLLVGTFFFFGGSNWPFVGRNTSQGFSTVQWFHQANSSFCWKHHTRAVGVGW